MPDSRVNYGGLGFGQGAALSGDRAHTMFGHVMGLVAVTMGFAALGAYLARNMNGGGEFIFLIAGIGCIWGQNARAVRAREQLAVALLFAAGLLLGMAISSIVVYYAKTNPGVVYEAAGATALFVGALGSYGYATRTDLSRVAQYAFYAFIPLFIFGIVTLFVVIPGSNIIYCVLMLIVFGAFTAFDFQRLARNSAYSSAPLIAATLFLDVFNIFLLFLSLFGGGNTRR